MDGKRCKLFLRVVCFVVTEGHVKKRQGNPLRDELAVIEKTQKPNKTRPYKTSALGGKSVR